MLYDVTNLKSWQDIPQWFDVISQIINPNTTIYLAGTKKDLVDERVVDIEQEKTYMKNNKDIIHGKMNVSNKPGDCVEDMFKDIVRLLVINSKEIPKLGRAHV